MIARPSRPRGLVASLLSSSLVVVLAVLVAGCGAPDGRSDGAGVVAPADPVTTSTSTPAPDPSAVAPPTAAAIAPAERPVPDGARRSRPAASAAPERVSIPSIGVDSRLEALGLRDDGSIAPPSEWEQAGWFVDGIEPGQPGPAVVAGHVDSIDGPAVFHRLGDLVPGDLVEVQRLDGSRIEFRVTGSRLLPKDPFPVEEVYGPATGPELRLVTCGGAFDRSTGHYEQNLVVFAVLVG